MRHVGTLALIASTVSLALGACSGDEGPGIPQTFEEACARVPGCQQPVNAVDGPTIAIWQVVLERDASGAVRVGELLEADVPSATGLPQGPLAGEHRLVAYDAAGQVLDAQAIRFPEEIVLEGLDEQAQTIPVSGATKTIGYLAVAAEVAKIAITDTDGKELHSRTPPSGQRSSASVKRSGLLQATSRTACAHVLLLEGPQDIPLFDDALALGYEIRPMPLAAQAVIRAALGRLTPLACAGISRIAFVVGKSTSTGAWVNGRLGDLMMINAIFDVEGHTFDAAGLQSATTRGILEGTVVHEAGHNAWRLLEMQSKGADKVVNGIMLDGWWAERQRGPARAAIARTRMMSGFGKEWQRLHNAFVAQGWAKPYKTHELERFAKPSPTDEELVEDGFMSVYGNKDYFEDIAELTRWPVFGDASRATGLPEGWGLLETADVACQQMRAHSSKDVPQKFAATYTKLCFMLDLGLITQQDFDRCAGNNIGINVSGNGFTVFESGNATPLRSFSTNPEAKIGSRSDRYVFVMSADGMALFGDSSYPATLRLELELRRFELLEQLLGGPDVDLVPWPRGLYSLNSGSPHRFSLDMPKEPKGSFEATKGWVLITRATNKLIVGSVFLEQAFRPFAGVPQVFNPPLQFRFRVSRP